MNKKVIIILSILVLLIVIGICAFYIIRDSNIPINTENEISQNSTNIRETENIIETDIQENTLNSNNVDNQSISNNNTIENNNTSREEDMKLYVKVNNRTLTATLEDNSSAKALIEKLEQEDITIDMEDYSNFEKVGPLGFSLPRNDKQITTKPGDIILYQGNQITIYYDINSWSFTKLGKLDSISQKALKEILGSGDVTVTLTLND